MLLILEVLRTAGRNNKCECDANANANSNANIKVCYETEAAPAGVSHELPSCNVHQIFYFGLQWPTVAHRWPEISTLREMPLNVTTVM